ncbi:hypothetical protein A3J90_01665 [candidate division WOR-1 bacterium RIFOXYC2_FULL_37_10]|uniref:Outer membrane protein beta-barrel domain-containing protein n=1 Tax=candidate division WOR-1 bacterium RIFOXYB2_FULL_37_13 TaxID=1802579 RepID=A0A1F4SRS9_UNCSA|nr:MAG: hypothetical protein A2246_02290 [candidate division WOR-1 bacterium RIFOXYA2_FULL_37_7]OGC22373.1 MAG: hypothetical protein A2310_01775 [candidate division WOR-1 bacterium RIFOXYB2_FULL_37_13]OGC35810.1 MAG: hypothetical protein A3J90_01665 [candidate division WOR-1 bacterium RIFOXYC2_FULL_37_10]
MKKTIALFVALAFILSVASLAFGRTLEEEKAAVRDYLKVIDAKIIKYRNQGNTTKVTVLQKEKSATLKRWEKVKAELMAQDEVTPPPQPTPPPPPPVKKPQMVSAPSAGLLGMGIETAVEVGMIGGLVGLTGNVIIPDPMQLGSMIGLSDKAISYKLGVGYAQGNDVNSNAWKAVPIIVDGVITLPADMMEGLSTFIGGGINYVAYRTGQTSGSIGGQIYVGAEGDLGLGGNTYGEVGYSVLRTGTSTKGQYTSKSVTVLIGQKIMF